MATLGHFGLFHGQRCPQMRRTQVKSPRLLGSSQTMSHLLAFRGRAPWSLKEQCFHLKMLLFWYRRDICPKGYPTKVKGQRLETMAIIGSTEVKEVISGQEKAQ